MKSFLIYLLLLLVALGCSGSDNPITSSKTTGDSISEMSFPISVTDRFPDGSPSAGVGVLGLFHLVLDAANVSANLTSLRQTALTDVLESVDISNFLLMAPCTDCAKIKSVALDPDNNIVVTIGIKHPFGVGDPTKPITGRNRADLHVFNVEGTLVSNLNCTMFGSDINVANFKLINADGYSGYLDPSLDAVFPTLATIHPYILHFDDYSKGNFDASNPMGFENVTEPPPTGNLVMAMGCDYDYKDYVFNLDEPIDFIYAIGCTYGVSAASMGQRFNPEYRIPQHNKKAASEVSVEIISNNLASGDPSSKAEVEIHIVDINHGVEIGDELDQMLVDSSVKLIRVYVPSVETDSISVDVSSPTGTGHDPSDPLVFPATITNSANGGLGIYPGLVKVVDSYLSGLNGSPLLNGMEGIKRVDPLMNPLTGLFSIYEFATYNIFEISIEHESGEPFADLKPNQIQVQINDTVVWDASDSFDPDGSIVMYEWDYVLENGDPANFSADEITTPPTSTQISPPYNDLGTFYAAVRVTDNDNKTDIAVSSFEVLEFIPHYWSQFMSNKNHNGQTTVNGPQTKNIRWTYTAPGTVPLNVVEGYDGTIYFGSYCYEGQPGPQRLDAVNPDGTQKWTYYPLEQTEWSSPLGVTPDDKVLYVAWESVNRPRKIVGIDTRDGYELWNYDFEINIKNQGLVLDNGDLVITGKTNGPHCAIRLDKNGNEIWVKNIETGYYSSPVQSSGPDGMIYIIVKGSIIALDPNSSDILYSYYYYPRSVTVAPAVRSDGTVILTLHDIWPPYKYFVACLDSTLHEQWILELDTFSIYGGIGIGLNDEIYLTAFSKTGRRTLYSIAPDGSHVDWSLVGASEWTSPAVVAGGTIYIGTTNGAAAINPDGTVLWYFTTTGYGSAPIVAHDGAMYILIEYGVLYKILD